MSIVLNIFSMNMAKKRFKATVRCRGVKEDGSVYYYYRRRKKPGPNKKPGPKKKRVLLRRGKVANPRYFKIIICNNKKQVATIGKFHNEDEVEIEKSRLLLENSNVIISKERNNDSSISCNIIEACYEYLVLKKNEYEDIEAVSKLPNKYGKLVEHKVTNNKWLIWDKFPCLIEETFWVFGYDKMSDRKDITWIYHNLIEPIIIDKYNILRILVYGNKLIIEDDCNNIELVICKTTKDSIRLYNKLNEVFCKNKRNCLFLGIIDKFREKKQKYIKLIQDKTKWTLKDIYRKSTRH